MNCQLIVLIGLLICLITITILPEPKEGFESTCKENNSSGCAGNNIKSDGVVDFTKFGYQPSNVTNDDVTITLPKHKCDNSMHNNLYCKFCYYDENGKWSCDQCRKNVEKKDDKFQSRYLRAMEAIDKIRKAHDKGEITDYTYHTLFTRWLKVYHDVTLLPEDKVEQLYCSSYLSIIDSAEDKTVFEDFIYNTWPSKCAARIPSILYGEIDNVTDVSDPSNKNQNLNSPDLVSIENLLNDINNNSKKHEKKTANIDDIRDQWNRMWHKDKVSGLHKGRQADG